MRAKAIVFLLVALGLQAGAQGLRPTISAMKWGADYNLHIKLANDSAYVVDVRGLYHTGKNLFIDTTVNSTTYYPVNLDREFINYIKGKNLETQANREADTAVIRQSYNTLWSALHGILGGGYVHFVNCLIYSLESQTLNLSDPIFQRPVTKWKPKPITKTYKRTRKWRYYYPNTQKLAHKEYKLRLKENDLADLHGVPASFIDLFLNTSQAKYEKLKREHHVRKVAKIDLVRLLLGAKYLGHDQIRRISSRVTNAVLKYNVNTMPSIIIFDDYNAAVALTLGKKGYKIDRIVYSDGEVVPGEELQGRNRIIEGIIKTVNEANERVFRKKLRLYYQKKR